jgi:hypothetical protein
VPLLIILSRGACRFDAAVAETLLLRIRMDE